MDGVTELRDRPMQNYYDGQVQGQNSVRNLLDYKTVQMVKMEAEIHNLHEAMARLEAEKEELENGIRQSYMAPTHGHQGASRNRLEQENKELKRMLSKALEERDFLQKERVSTNLQKREMPLIFDTPHNQDKVDRQYMDDDDSIHCNSVEGSLYFK